MQNETTREAPRFGAHPLHLDSDICDGCGRHLATHLGVDAYCPDRPQVGDLATVAIGSDRYPGRVISVSPSGHRVVVAELDTTVESGSVIDGSAKYRVAFNPRRDARTWTVTRRGGTRHRVVIYRVQGWDTSGIVRFGYADAYRDPSF